MAYAGSRCSWRSVCPYTGTYSGGSAFPRIMSAAFSASMMVGAFRLPETMLGMIEASTTRSVSTPMTRQAGVTTAPSELSLP